MPPASPPAPIPHPADGDAPAGSPRRRLVEVGWVITEPIEALDRAAVHEARDRALAWLERELPEFTWSFPLSERTEPLSEPRVPPMRLVDVGTFERDAKRWDFAFVVTGAELTGLDRRFALGATSRCEAVAVASTLRLDPAESRALPSEDERRRRIRARLTFLFLRCFAVLNGLEPRDLGLGPEAIADALELDVDPELGPEGRDALAERLRRVADPRVEEERPSRGPLAFYLRALAADPRAVPNMVRWARPWLFPIRLGRMSAAALSVLLVVMLTAEAWEVGATRSGWQVLSLVAAALTGTTALVIIRQGLLVRSGRRLTEQIALSNVSTILAVASGLLATFAVLFLAAFLGSLVFFDGMGAKWVGVEALSFGQRAVFAAFGAAVGIVAGALGASFEESEDFRHIARIDREL